MLHKSDNASTPPASSRNRLPFRNDRLAPLSQVPRGPSPPRAPPPPPPLETHLQQARTSTDVDPKLEPIPAYKPIFAPVEQYISTCFSSIESLNISFQIPKPPPLFRAASESAAVESDLRSPRSDDLMNFPEIDAKTLLLGDFAENGTWWSGKIHDQSRRTQKVPRKPLEEGPNDRVNARSPHIQWQELSDWYTALSSTASCWRHRVKDLKNQNLGGNALSVDLDRQIENDFSQASLHLQRMVLKASENLLRRPGRPIRKPDECRFLLILLANPQLYTSDSANSGAQNIVSRENTTIDTASSMNRRPQPEKQARPVQNRDQGSASEQGPNKHTGIIKRILGLISNLPGECQQYLVSWFSRFEEARFRDLVDLISSFVSYRLSRQHKRKRSNNHDPTGGLIPSISGPGAGTSAQLHAALGAVTNKKVNGADGGIEYGDDWQIKSAARTMSLLFFANNNDRLVLRQEGNKQPRPEASRPRAGSSAGSSARKRVHLHGQIIPTNAFYSTLLDHSDLIADFETWESRRAKFTFCQYPMFLSIWAKIRIMEHDAHRQMEIKAREAFFSSIMSRKAVNQQLVLSVRRDCLVEDSLRGVSEVVGTGQEEIKKGLRIDFVGEEGFDSGGLRKEWFLLLVREIFDPEYGLFVYDEDSRYCYFNPSTFETSDQFFLVGVLLGLAIYNSTILDVALPPFAFRKLLASAPSHIGPAPFSSRPVSSFSLEDLSEYRPALAQGLRQLLDYEGDVESTFCQDFVVVTERYGQSIVVPLCTNGEKRSVTNANRREFVDLYIRYLLETSVARQYEPFKRGFFTVCGGNALSLFRPEEIELLIRGSEEESLDVATLRSVAVYDNWGGGGRNEFDRDGNREEPPVVTWFWDAFLTATPQDQRKLLRFITASDRIPAMGAASLVIKIVCHGDNSSRFPTARTCFNMIALYRYPSREVLNRKLWMAVKESEGFGIR